MFSPLPWSWYWRCLWNTWIIINWYAILEKNRLALVDLFCLLENKKVAVCTSLPFDTCVIRLLFPFSHLTIQRELGLLSQLLKTSNTVLLSSHPLFFIFFLESFNSLIKESSISSIKFSFAVPFSTGRFFFTDFT